MVSDWTVDEVINMKAKKKKLRYKANIITFLHKKLCALYCRHSYFTD